jgi:hypothetical protein
VYYLFFLHILAKENVQVINDQNDAQVDQSLASALKGQQWKTTLGSTMARIELYRF